MPDSVIPAVQDSGGKGLPPLLTVEHQELIRSVERLKTEVPANRKLIETQLADLVKMLDERYTTQQAEALNAAEVADKALKAALSSQEKAIDKADTASEKRFTAINEFRGQLGDVIATMFPRAEAEARFQAIDDKLADMKSLIDKGFAGVDMRHETGGEYRSASRDNTQVMTAVLGVLIALALLALAAASALHR